MSAAEREPTEHQALGGRVEGEVRDIEPRPGGWRVTLAPTGAAGRLQVDVPRTGHPRLDAWPAGAGAGSRVRILLGPDSGSNKPYARTRAAALIDVRRPPRWWDLPVVPARVRVAFRDRVVRRLASSENQRDRSGLVVTLMTGMRAWMTPDVAAGLRHSGLAHLLVVSGLHVAWIVLGTTGIVKLVAGRSSPVSRASMILSAFSAAALLPLTAPVRRATGAVVLARLAAWTGRGAEPEGALSSTVVMLLALDPGLCSSWSFTLTVAAAASLTLARRRRRAGSRALLMLAAPALATWPLLVLMTHRVSPWGVLMTAPAIPVAAAALAVGWIAVLLPDGPVAAAAAGMALECAGVLSAIVRFAAGLPGSGRMSAPVGPIWAAALYIALALWLLRPRGSPAGTSSMLVCLLLFTWPLRPSADREDSEPELWTFDVGQGQAVLVREREAAVLLDTADDRDWSGTRRLISRLHELGVRDVDLLLVSHADRDHAGGLHEMSAALAPRAILLPDAALDAPELLSSIGAAALRGIPARPLRAGDSVTVGPLSIDVQSPERGWRTGDNEASLVVRVQTSGFSAWIPGDAGLAVEKRLLASRSIVSSDILVAAHHGSRDATSSDFLAALAPRAVLVSSGVRNRFGHPHAEFVRRVNAEKARLFITAIGGDVRVGMWRSRLIVLQPGISAPD